jgi:molybdate transport system permease protein
MSQLRPTGRLLTALAVALLALPFIALLVELPWSDLMGLLSDETVTGALRVTAIVVPVATAVVFAIGTPVAWLLARHDGAWVTALRALVLVPVVLPPVVSGLLLLSAFGRRGLLGPALESVGIVLPFTIGATTLAAVFVALPFYVLAAESGFRELPAAMLDAARTLGTPMDRLLDRVGLRNARPAIAAGLALAAARALGEFGATITFAGNVDGATRTLPLATFSALEQDPDIARVIGLALVLISVAVIVLLRNSLLRGPA